MKNYSVYFEVRYDVEANSAEEAEEKAGRMFDEWVEGSPATDVLPDSTQLSDVYEEGQ